MIDIYACRVSVIATSAGHLVQDDLSTLRGMGIAVISILSSPRMDRWGEDAIELQPSPGRFDESDLRTHRAGTGQSAGRPPSLPGSPASSTLIRNGPSPCGQMISPMFIPR